MQDTTFYHPAPIAAVRL